MLDDYTGVELLEVQLREDLRLDLPERRVGVTHAEGDGQRAGRKDRRPLRWKLEEQEAERRLVGDSEGRPSVSPRRGSREQTETEEDRPEREPAHPQRRLKYGAVSSNPPSARRV